MTVANAARVFCVCVLATIQHESPTLDPLLAGLVSAFIITAVIITLLLFLKLRRRDNRPEFRRLQDLPMVSVCDNQATLSLHFSLHSFYYQIPHNPDSKKPVTYKTDLSVYLHVCLSAHISVNALIVHGSWLPKDKAKPYLQLHMIHTCKKKPFLPDCERSDCKTVDTFLEYPVK